MQNRNKMRLSALTRILSFGKKARATNEDRSFATDPKEGEDIENAGENRGLPEEAPAKQAPSEQAPTKHAGPSIQSPHGSNDEVVRQGSLHASDGDPELRPLIKSNKDAIVSLSAEVNQDKQDQIFPQDSFSFMAMSSKSKGRPWLSFWVALGVFAFQIATLSLLMKDTIDNTREKNRLGIPAGVEREVHISQLIALIITVISQDEVRQSLNVLYNCYDPNLLETRFGGSWPKFSFGWNLSWFFRFVEGSFSLAITFMLLITVDNVRDLLLNFTAVQFVSEVDDTIFLLSKWGYFGETMKADAEAIENAREAPTPETDPDTTCCKPPKKFPRMAALILIFLALFGGWVAVMVRQRKGKYLCSQTIYVQFGDDFLPTLGTFSGLYAVKDMARDRLQMKQKHGRRVQYVLNHAGGFSTSARFVYCLKKRVWTFSYGGEWNTTPDPCENSGVIRAISSESFAFDLSDTASGTWFFQANETAGKKPMQHFAMCCRSDYFGKTCRNEDECGDRFTCNGGRCVCEPGWYGLGCQYEEPCNDLVTNEINEGFAEARSWSTKYRAFKDATDSTVQVYGHPLYFGDNTQVDKGVNQSDLMFFTGRRWVLTHTGRFDELKNNASLSNASIAEFMAAKFHAHWSNYAVAFISESVDYDTPLDGPTPIGLKWFHAKTKTGTHQTVKSHTCLTPDPNRVTNAQLLCATCDEDRNPCLFNGTCRHDGTCECTSGSTGTLCQVTPDGDGLCNPFYNNPEYGYDRGDCCPATCSSADHSCGKVEFEGFGIEYRKYVGFPNCIDPKQRCDGPCWEPLFVQSGSTEGSRAGESVALADNGAVLAMYEPGTGSVLIFEQDGFQWVPRGQLKHETTTSAPRPHLSPTLAISEDGGIIALASPSNINDSGSVRVFRWISSRSSWRQLGNAIPEKQSVALSSDGGILATGRTSESGENVSHSLTVLEYKPGMDWTQLGSDIVVQADNKATNENGCPVSLSSNGTILAAGLGVYRYTSTVGWDRFNATFVPQLRTDSCFVAMSGNGGVLAASLTNTSQLRVYKYNHTISIWSQMGSEIDGWQTASKGGSASLSRDGTVLAVGVPFLYSVKVYEYREEYNKTWTWTQFGPELSEAPNDRTGSSVSLSYDGTTLAYGAPKFDTESYGIAKVVWSTRNRTSDPEPPLQQEEGVNVSVRLKLDEYPEDTAVELECDDTVLERHSWGAFDGSKGKEGEGTVMVPRDAKCKFRMKDLDADGICCSKKRRGFYQVFYGMDTSNSSNLLAQGGKVFGSREQIAFDASQPASLVNISVQVNLDARSKNQVSLDTVGFDVFCGNILEVEAPPGVFRRSYPLREDTFLVPSGSECNLTLVSEQSTTSRIGYGRVAIYYENDTRIDENLIQSVALTDRYHFISFIAEKGCRGCECVPSDPEQIPPINCSDGFTPFRFELDTDEYGGETFTQLHSLVQPSNFTFQDAWFTDMCATFVDQKCIPDGVCFLYIIKNNTCIINDDAVSCQSGSSNWTLFLGSEVFQSGDNFCCEDLLKIGDCDVDSTTTPPTVAPSAVPDGCDAGESPLRIDLTTDNYPQDTQWEVVDAFGNILLSGGPYKLNNYSSETIVNQTCIPSDSCAMFVITDSAGDGLCCEYGHGEYMVSFGSENATGGNFTWEDRHQFGDCPPSSPTMAPPTNAPSISSTECQDNYTLLHFELTTDRKPEETSWKISTDETGETLMAGGPYRPLEDSYTTFVNETCVPSDACISLQLEDMVGDGICCKHGHGSYRLFLAGSLLVEGGDFFGVYEDNFGSCPVPEPVPTSPPTVAQLICDNGTAPIRVELYIDNYPEEAVWEVVDKSNGNATVLLRGGPYNETQDAFETFVNQTCVSNAACYAFHIWDTYGDGICCDSGYGYYKVYFGGEVVASGGDFGFNETVDFGNCIAPAPATAPPNNASLN